MLTYFNVPAVTTTFSGAAEWFNPILTDFLPWALLAIGVIIGFGGLSWLISQFRKILHH